MKTIYKLTLGMVLAAGLTACDFDTANYQQIPSGNEYQTVQDVQNGMNGAYYALGSYRFLGNYVVAYGDFCAGVSQGSTSSGYYLTQSNWAISETTAETEDIWYYGFQVIDRCTRTIAGGKKVLADESLHLDETETAEVNLYRAQCYAMKALANYYLVNLFAYPYAAGTDEDIFTIAKSENDNLSANALNTYYGSYECTLSNATLSLFEASDYRYELLSGLAIGKYAGLPTSQATSNIPVFRKSEMSLIVAEVYAREGHRFYDARRMGDIIRMDGFEPFDIAKFVFPIPSAEINAGFCGPQNEGWSDGLPTRN